MSVITPKFKKNNTILKVVVLFTIPLRKNSFVWFTVHNGIIQCVVPADLDEVTENAHTVQWSIHP